MSVEAILILPLIFFGLMLVYTYFSAFQLKGMSNKAAYTVSDYISRQTDPVDSDFIDGLADIYGFLTNTGSNTLRISSIIWAVDGNDTDYKLQWSYGANDAAPLTDLSTIEHRLPNLRLGETVLIVEASNDFTPIFDVGLEIVSFADFVATKPRFATQVLFDDGGQETGESSTGDDVEPSDSYGTYGGEHHSGWN
jgi:hypothetical protein